MFKKENQIWLYLIGVLIMFGILVTIGREIIIPFIYGGQFKVVDTNDFKTPPAFAIDTNKDYLVNITTNYGTITIDLFEKSAPLNVNNFVYLSQNGYYTRTKFHRLIKDFLLQGGDRNTLDSFGGNDGFGRTGYVIKDEINWDSLDLKEDKRSTLLQKGYSTTPGVETPNLERFSVAMANQGPNTNSSQFFIIISDPDDNRLAELDGYFTVIGKVVSGGNVLEQISKIETAPNSNGIDTPTSEIVLQNIEIYTR